ncbi:MAG TPA: CATRA conflict system CASPASE/TPR repeat-associated protein [Pseudonocardiaceae bacterium]
MAAVITEQELVVHLFAATDGPAADLTRRQIMRIWQRCRDRGMDVPTGLPGVPNEPPDELPARSAVIAACRSRDGGLQAVVRKEHDVLNLSILLRPRGAVGWRAQDRLLDDVLGAEAHSLIGLARLYLGKTDQVPSQPHDSLRLLLPRGLEGGSWRRHRIADGLTVWERSQCEDDRVERRLLVLTTPNLDRQLSTWTWTHDGRPDLPALARYLMHTAKVRYQLRVHAEFGPIGDLCQDLDDGAARLRHAVDHGGPDPHREVVRLRAGLTLATETTTALEAMRRTVEIAAENAAHVLAAPASSPADDLVGDDSAVATWFVKHLGNDLGYLNTSRAGARRMIELADGIRPQDGGGDGRPTLGIVTALPEEYTAMATLLDDHRRTAVGDDRATYLLGTLPSSDEQQAHRVVLTLLGDTGTHAAAGGCVNLIRSFNSVNCVVMVGIAAGVPNIRRPRHHVRLGDIVVSDWSVADYDHVIDTPAGPIERQAHPRPSPWLVHAVLLLEAEELRGRRPWEDLIALGQSRLADFERPPAATDLVYTSDRATRAVAHPDPKISGHRPGRPKVHRGRVGSGDRSLRSIRKRDELATRHDLRAIEMEGTGVAKAGFSSGLEWLVIRGISDYGDRRTTTTWRKYAALAAAAYTRALLATCSPVGTRGGHTRAVQAPQESS